MKSHNKAQYRLDRNNAPSLRNWGPVEQSVVEEMKENTTLKMGWGDLIFGQTFENTEDLIEAVCRENADRRNIAMYIRDPHVLLAAAPQRLFLDPSHTYRLWFSSRTPTKKPASHLLIQRVTTEEDIAAMNRIYASCGMVTVDESWVMRRFASREMVHLIARDPVSKAIVGTVTGVDHVNTFNDPEGGSSLWCLAVDPQCPLPAVGAALVNYLADFYQARGRAYLDLSVLHDNKQAISLYEKLGFQRVPVYTVKHKNALNQNLYITSDPAADLNPYAQIIIKEALKRGIDVDILDAENGYFELRFGGRRIVCRESLSELTSAVAMSRCQDKRLTRKILEKEGYRVPSQTPASTTDHNLAFLKKHERIVVKPALGEQGAGISVDVRTADALELALDKAEKAGGNVILESFEPGQDVRIIVIDGEMVAAAVRKPPKIIGTGKHDIQTLIEKQSRRRAAATGGESRIPLDEECRRCVGEAGYSMEDILPSGQVLIVRKTANLHTGGTIHDVTEQIHPEVVAAARGAARVLGIPVVGFDFLMPDISGRDYVIIEANERPGLANHEPQPTAQRFLDLLFPIGAHTSGEFGMR